MRTETLTKNINIINQRLCILINNWELCLTINHLDPSNSISMRLENTTRIKLVIGTSIPWWHLHLLLQALQSSKKTHVGGMPGPQAEFGTLYWNFPNIKWGEVSASFLGQILWFNKTIINQMESALLLLAVWSFTPRIYTKTSGTSNWCLFLHGLHLLLQLFFTLCICTRSRRNAVQRLAPAADVSQPLVELVDRETWP